MKIIELKAENYKRLSAVSIAPVDDVVILSGANDQGKSSVLDAIQAAIAGGRGTKDTTEPIRRGEEKAEVSLDLGDLRIKRVLEPGKNRVEVTNADGAKYSSPQAMLDSLTGSLTFDPLEFARMQPKEQRATLLRLVDIPFDIDENDRQRVALVQAETEARQELRRAERTAEGLPAVPDGTPDEEVSATSLFQELNKLNEEKRGIDRKREGTDAANAVYQESCEKVLRLKLELKEIQEGLQIAENSKKRRFDDWVLQKAELDLMKYPDTSEVEGKIAKLDETNKNIRQKKANAIAQDSLNAATIAAADAKKKVAAHDKARADALAAAEFPVDGLGFSEDGVTLNGLPFSQASESQRIKTSVAMGMAMNPKLHVMLVRDGSLLDSKRMGEIAAMAREKAWQLWVEKVDETGKVGVVIEDGKVREEVR